MIWVYRFIFIPAFLLSIPYLLWHMKRRGGYQENFLQKFGKLPHLPPKASKKRIWIQAVSVGEVRAIKPLLVAMTEHSDWEVVLTSSSSTGYHIAKKDYAGRCLAICYFPFDFITFIRKAHRRIQADFCILMEAELWPEHIRTAVRRRVPVALINARISDKTFKIHRRLRWLYPHVFKSLDLVVASNERNAQRFHDLGVDSKRIISVGNLKCDVRPPEPLSPAEKNQLLGELGMPLAGSGGRETLILCGASTWPGEEKMLINLYQTLRKEGLPLRLLITPRHMERRHEIRRELEGHPLSWHFRSAGPAPGPVDICVADTTGELNRLQQVADLVFVGRSMPPNRGGQTPIEAAQLGKPIVFGPDMSNFRDIASSLIESGVATRVQNEMELKNAVRALCLDEQARKQTAAKAEIWQASCRGATQRTLEALKVTLTERRK